MSSYLRREQAAFHQSLNAAAVADAARDLAVAESNAAIKIWHDLVDAVAAGEHVETDTLQKAEQAADDAFARSCAAAVAVTGARERAERARVEMHAAHAEQQAAA